MPSNLTDLLLGEDRSTIEQIVGEMSQNETGIPVGGIVPIASHLVGSYTVPISGNVDSQGFMYCDGSTIPASQTLEGTLPDLTSGRFLRGSTEAGATGGADSFTLEVANLPAHTHTGPAHTHTGPAHTHTADHNHTASSNTTGSHTHSYSYRGTKTIAQDLNGGGQTHISGLVGSNTGSSGSHSHTITVNTKSFSTGSSGTGNTGSAGDGATSSTGEGTAKSHIPKYVDIQYIIKVK